MANHASTDALDDLKNQLRAIQTEWGSQSFGHDEGVTNATIYVHLESVEEMTNDHWAMENHRVSRKDAVEMRPFVGAWEGAMERAEQLFPKICEWADALVNEVGTATFGGDFSERPPEITGNLLDISELDPDSLRMLLTGAETDAEAGRRTIVWAAHCHNRPRHRSTYLAWSHWLVELGQNDCRPLPDVFYWLDAAIDQLSSNLPAESRVIEPAEFVHQDVKAEPNATEFENGPCEGNCFRWNGERVPLTPRGWQLAKAIYDAPEHQIGKDELLRRFKYKESGLKSALDRLGNDIRKISKCDLVSRNRIVEMQLPKALEIEP